MTGETTLHQSRHGVSGVRSRTCVRCLLLVLLLFGLARLTFAQGGADPSDEYLYEVLPGDTLIGIGESLLADPLDWRHVRKLNGIANARQLQPGSWLRVPMALLLQRQASAEVAFAQGSVTAQASGSDSARALRVGDTVRSGELLRTEAAASLTLILHDSSRIVVRASSRVRIDRLLIVGRADFPLVQLGVERGDAELRVAPAAKQRRFELKTPAVNLGVRGTEFQAHVDGGAGIARLEVFEGLVQGQSGVQSVPVAAGLGLVAVPGEPLPAPQPLLDAPRLDGVAKRYEALPLRLHWQALPGASGYRAEVGETPPAGGSADLSAVLYDGDLVEPVLRLADLPDGRYTLRVRALDRLMLRGAQASLDFIVKARPAPPLTREPAPALRLYGDSVEFSWAPNAAARSYQLQITDSAGFDTAPRVDQTALTDTAFHVALPAGDYRWRVRSVAAGPDGHDDPGPWGPAQAFSLRPVPQIPALQAPAVGADGLLLRWRAPLPGEQVLVQLARDPAFAGPLVERAGAIDSLRLDDPEPGSYYLRIRTQDQDGFAGPWSASQRIDVPHSKVWWWIPGLLLMLLLL